MRSALMRRVATVQRIVERVEAEARSARQNEARALAKGLHRLETTLDAKLELVLSGIAETTRHINIRRGDCARESNQRRNDTPSRAMVFAEQISALASGRAREASIARPSNFVQPPAPPPLASRTPRGRRPTPARTLRPHAEKSPRKPRAT